MPTDTAASPMLRSGMLRLDMKFNSPAATVSVAGVSLVVAGVIYLLPELAVGLALIGVGLIISVIGVIFLVGSVKLCAVAIPGICRGIVWLCRRPFQRKVVA